MKSSSPTKEVASSNYHSSQQQYEEEFWNLKAQRLEAKNEELAKENQALLKKLMDASRREQQLQEKLALEGSDPSKSRRKDQKKEKSSDAPLQEEVERLGKEIRTLKSNHSLELTKANEEIKRLKKKTGELEGKQLSCIPIDEHSNKVKSLTDELASLNKKQISSEQQLERVREEKRKLQEENESLRKEIQLMHVKSKAAEKQEEENLIDRRKYEKFIYQYKAERPSPQLTEQGPAFDDLDSSNLQEIQSLRQSVSALEKEREASRKLILQMSSWEHEKARGEAKMRQVESELDESRAELSNVLAKLAPLLSQRSQLKGKENVDARASLTLLEIFLKKYRIQAF